MGRSQLHNSKVKNRDLLYEKYIQTIQDVKDNNEKLIFYPTSERCADPHLFFFTNKPTIYV